MSTDTDSIRADVRLEQGLLAVEGEQDVHAMLELAAPDASAEEGLPLALAFVLDRSGSMEGTKLDYAKRCADWLVGRLRPIDRLALVAYDDDVRLLSSLALVDRRALRQAIASIWPAGSTNLSGGWVKGGEQLESADGDGARKVRRAALADANEIRRRRFGVGELPRLARETGHPIPVLELRVAECREFRDQLLEALGHRARR